jgi:undecaprenyl pyrophosphate phosphatase UppP
VDRRELAHARDPIGAIEQWQLVYLAFIVALHVGTALALLWFFRADWIRIITGFLRSCAAA